MSSSCRAPKSAPTRCSIKENDHQVTKAPSRISGQPSWCLGVLVVKVIDAQRPPILSARGADDAARADRRTAARTLAAAGHAHLGSAHPPLQAQARVGGHDAARRANAR